MEFLKRIKIDYLLGALTTIAIGLILIFWPNATLIFISKALAVLLGIIGVVFIIAFFFRKVKLPFDSLKLIVGILVAAIGSWIFVNPNTFTDFIPKLFGVFLIASGLMNLGQTVFLIKYTYKLWWVCLILGLLTVGLGAFLLFKSSLAKELIVQVIGYFLAFDGISNLWTLSRVTKFAKVADQAIKDAVAIDTKAEITDVADSQDQ